MLFAWSTLTQVLTEVVLAAIRGQLSGARLSLVRAAFARLECAGNRSGEAAASDVIGAFDPAHHPEVIAGRQSSKVRG